MGDARGWVCAKRPRAVFLVCLCNKDIERPPLFWPFMCFHEAWLCPRSTLVCASRLPLHTSVLKLGLLSKVPSRAVHPPFHLSSPLYPFLSPAEQGRGAKNLSTSSSGLEGSNGPGKERPVTPFLPSSAAQDIPYPQGCLWHLRASPAPLHSTRALVLRLFRQVLLLQ